MIYSVLFGNTLEQYSSLHPAGYRLWSPTAVIRRCGSAMTAARVVGQTSVTNSAHRQLSRATTAQCPASANQSSKLGDAGWKKRQPPRAGHIRGPRLLSALLPWARGALLSWPLSPDKASRMRLSKVTITHAAWAKGCPLHESEPQVLTQNLVMPLSKGEGGQDLTKDKGHHSQSRTHSWGHGMLPSQPTPTQLEKMSLTNPCTTQRQSQPCSKPGQN